MKKGIYLFIVILLCSCSPKLFKEKWTNIQAPETFNARFETTQGNFDIEAKREWAPNGVDRLYQLITKNYYQDISIFRVVPNFVAQFGIHNDTLINNSWQRSGIIDEPVTLKNDAMTIAFARGGVKSRSNQIFINLKDNYRLDKLAYSGVTGFPVVAKVVAGKEVILKFYDGYGEKLGRKQDMISKFGNVFVREKYPKTDFIIRAYILE
jgi:peptidyl-prolyl cis-trans isomerase A (cyclophilin A)|tara:strand:- start:130 stop:756 length:627 start_codon:yes stop_codon:yes gene_type:complete